MATGKRIKDLDAQATRSSVLRIPVDHSSFDDAKYITIEALTPLISEESSQAISNRATDIVRFNDGAGNEYYTNINDIYELINDLDVITNLGDYDKIRLADYSDSFVEKGVSLDSLADFMAADGALTAMADARINAVYDDTSVWGAEMKESAVSSVYGYLYLARFKKQVNAVFVTATGYSGSKTLLINGTTNIPASLRPVNDIIQSSEQGAQIEKYRINADGTMVVDDPETTYTDGAAFGYVTA